MNDGKKKIILGLTAFVSLLTIFFLIRRITSDQPLDMGDAYTVFGFIFVYIILVCLVRFLGPTETNVDKQYKLLAEELKSGKRQWYTEYLDHNLYVAEPLEALDDVTMHTHNPSDEIEVRELLYKGELQNEVMVERIFELLEPKREKSKV